MNSAKTDWQKSRYASEINPATRIRKLIFCCRLFGAINIHQAAKEVGVGLNSRKAESWRRTNVGPNLRLFYLIRIIQ